MPQLFELGDLETLEVSLVKRGANRKRIALTKGEGEVPDLEIIKAALETQHDDEPDLDDQGKLVFRAIKAFDLTNTSKEAIAKLFVQPAEPKEEEPELAPEVQEKLELLQKAADAEREKREALEKRLEEQRAEAELKELVQKAERELTYVPGEAKEVAELLQKARAAGLGGLEELLRTMSDQLGKSELFKMRGSRGQDSSDAQSAIDSKVEELRKADPKLSKEQAFVRVIKAHPELKAALRKEGN